MKTDLAANTEISHYRIVSKIGAGGMGAVYRAEDSRLDREVAIKVLPAEMSGDADRLQRFEREAKATSALNHPNILTVYDIGEHDGSPFIVAELLEGEELRQRLDDGPIQLRKVTEYALQIVSGLSAAHEKGIVHRDLKPENLFITTDDRVKILDFGLAKLSQPETIPSGSEDATRKALTKPGVVMGTVGYMSPEQVRGQATDHRSDIFSFGLILYEMITGRRAFQEESMAETMSAIVKDEPPEITESNPNISPSLERIVRRCLEKKPERRFQSTADLAFALEAISPQSGASREFASADNSLAVAGKKMPTWAFLAAAVAITSVIAGVAGWGLRRPAVNDPRMIVNLVSPKHITLNRVGSLSCVTELSPDGKALLVSASDGLYVRNFTSTDFYKVPGTDDARNQPSWIGSSALSFSDETNSLVSVRLPDGPPEADTDFGRRGFTRGRSWSDKGTALISMFDHLETRGNDGTPVVVENTTKRVGRFYSPEFIPGSEDFLVYFRERGSENGEVWLATLSGGSMTNVNVLFKNETAARFTPYKGGRVLFVKSDNLYVHKLDLSERRVVGEAELVVRGVASQPAGGIAKADFSVSRNGVIAWRSGRAGSSQVTIYDRTGKVINTAGPPSDSDTILVSPKDESRVLVIGDAGYTSFIAEVGQHGKAELGGGTFWLGWTADGERLFGFRGDDIFTRPVDGGEESLIGRNQIEGEWGFMDLSPDGRNLLVTCGAIGPLCVSSLSADGVFGKPVPIRASKDALFDASFSPDGASIVYSVVGEGVYVQPFPGPGRRVQIAAKGADPIWRQDGKEILFVDGYSSVMSVSVSGLPGNLSFGEPQKLFDGLRRSSSAVSRSKGLDVSRDGSRIYWVQGAEQPEDGVINVMFGFLDNN